MPALQPIREKTARQNVIHFAGTIGKIVGLSNEGPEGV